MGLCQHSTTYHDNQNEPNRQTVSCATVIRLGTIETTYDYHHSKKVLFGH